MPAELQIALALISTTTVVGGFVFAAYQFVAFVRQRRQETALTLIMADDLIGGMVRLTWRKCRGYIGQFRAVAPTAFEWFERLYDRMEQYPAAKDPGVGAHVSRKDWKP